MDKKIGRNDPCPCGSGKKYKQCCQKLGGTKKKFTAKVISSGPKKEGSGPDLMERTFGKAIAQIKSEEKKNEESEN